jgi:hypothetical protein
MPVLFKGIVHVSGELDTGKTMFAFSCGAQPEDIAFIDDDIKGASVVDQIESQKKKLGFYRNLYDASSGLTELKFFDKGIEIISDMEKEVEKRKKPFDAIIWDTWARFEGMFHPYVVTYPQKFRQYWSPNGVIKGAEQWKASFNLESEILNRLQKVGKLVILTSHLKPETIPGGKKTGKFIPDCKQPVAQKSLLRVYLRHNPDGPYPIGLILKRISRQVVGDKGIEIVSVLPRKMKPFTWERIRWYWDNPIGDRPLDANEKPDEYELSILDGTLTEDQKYILHSQPDVVPEEEEAPLAVNATPEVISRVKELKAQNKPNPVIARELELSVREVGAILSQ